jgi:hypothetical protein
MRNAPDIFGRAPRRRHRYWTCGLMSASSRAQALRMNSSAIVPAWRTMAPALSRAGALRRFGVALRCLDLIREGTPCGDALPVPSEPPSGPVAQR